MNRYNMACKIQNLITLLLIILNSCKSGNGYTTNKQDAVINPIIRDQIVNMNKYQASHARRSNESFT